MKALIHLSVFTDLDNRDDIEAMALAIRQNVWLSITETLERDGISPDELAERFLLFEPAISYEMDLAIDQ